MKKGNNRKDKYCKEEKRRAKGFASIREYKRETQGCCKIQRKKGGAYLKEDSEKEKTI